MLEAFEQSAVSPDFAGFMSQASLISACRVPTLKISDSVLTVLTCVQPTTTETSPQKVLKVANANLTLSSKPKSGKAKRAQRRVLDPTGFSG